MMYTMPRHRENGFICSDTQDGWLEGLTFFQSAFNRRSCGRAARSIIENGRSIDDYARTLGAIFEGLIRSRGEPGQETGRIGSPALTEESLFDDALSKHRGFGWDNTRLIVFDGSVRRHVLSADIVPVLLDLGL